MKIYKFFKLIFVLSTLTITFFFFANFSNVLNDNTVKLYRELYSEKNVYLNSKSIYKNISCYFGISKLTNCVEINSTIYLPFDLIRKKFDVIFNFNYFNISFLLFY